jgi:uncharacterized protein (DUF362 family)/NAD-dependent dihydropyrimidine dehydrogenase PreA subunit
MKEVYVVRCSDYSEVGEKMADLFEMMGGIEKFVSPGERIVLKVNLLAAAEPEKAVTTHPKVVASVARMVKGSGATPVIADSPGSGYPYTKKTLERTYRASEMDKVAEDVGIALNYDTSFGIVSYPEGEHFKRFEIITPVLESDSFINLCKLKTHGFTHMTGAVKNIFGIIPGLTKPGYHAKLQEKNHFASMLLDLAAFASPRLSIMDAVVGMEGNGPHSGDPRHVGLILASSSPLALDVIAGEIMGLPKKNNPVLVEAERRGLSPVNFDQVELIGIDPSELRIPGFKLPPTVPAIHDRLFSFLYPLVKKGFSVKPRIIKDKCISCGTCRDACPVGVITVSDNIPAEIDNKGCIRCYCCHEMCPHDAIELHQSRLYRMLNRRRT